MGGSQSLQLTADILEDYSSLTYLNKGEVMHLMKKFYSIDPEKLKDNFHHRFSKEEIVAMFPVLQNNPFQDRLFRVFSSKKDDCFSFEDLLDMCSAMSSECPSEVKAAWAFRIYDIDEDNQINATDICDIIDRLTWDPHNRSNKSNYNHIIDKSLKMKIAETILNETNLDGTGGIDLNQFKIAMYKIPEFRSSFYFKL